MNNSGTLFINKAIEMADFKAFARHGISAESFVSKADRAVYKFIEDYYDKNRQMPSIAMVADTFEDFVIVPNVTDRYEALAENITNRRLAVAFNDFFGSEFDNLQKETNGDTATLISTLEERLSAMRSRYSNTRSVGVGLKAGVDNYVGEYNKRKDGKSFKTWKSFMPYINEETNGYSSGNVYVWYGQSGRGKSMIVLREALETARQGGNVLIWSLEMPAYDVMTRLYTMLSAVLEKTVLTTDDGRILKAGYNSAGLLAGNLDDETEQDFMTMLAEINDHLDGNIVIRAVDDIDFHRRNITQLQADAEAVNADMVIVDPFYYLDYEANTSKTTGGDAANTSMKLRRMAGESNVVVMAMTQAEEDEKEVKPDTIRELKLASRKAVKKTKALLEDASALIAIDTDYRQGRGIVGINKGRTGGEGTSTEITFLPQFGIINQVEIEADMFDF